MKNQPEQPASEPAKTVSESLTNEDLYKRFGEAGMNLARAQQAAQAGGQSRTQDAYRNFFSALQSIADDFSKRSQESHDNYMKALSDALLQPDSPKNVEEIYNSYIQALQKLSEEAKDRYQKVHERYLSELRDAQADVQRLGLQAYRDYLSAQKQIWAQLDVNAFVAAASG